MFDVFRFVAQRTLLEGLRSELKRVLLHVTTFDFGAQFFRASGKGRVRVKNVILRAAGLIADGDLSDGDRADYIQLIESQNSVSDSQANPDR